MKIAIVGAGAMGCLYGGKISSNIDNEVWLLDVWQQHIDNINSNGLLMEEKDTILKYDRVKGATEPSVVGVCDLAVIFVKSTLTGQAILKNKEIFGEETIVLTLQNGLGNIDEISNIIGSKNIIAGTTAHGATMLSPGKMRHAGVGKTIIGELDGSRSKRINKIYEMFQKVGLETEISDNVLGLIWDKLLVNVGINAITGITEVANGKLAEIPELEEILEKAVNEAFKVAKEMGIKLSYSDPVLHTKEVCKLTSDNKSSMLQDILNKRLTEIDMINGAIVKQGKKLGIDTPVNEVLTNLIKWKQSII